MQYYNRPIGAGRVCLFTRMEDNCKHPECVSGKTAAQAQPAKAFSQGGLMASLQARSDHYRFRESKREGSR